MPAPVSQTIDLNMEVSAIQTAFNSGRRGEAYGRAEDLYSKAPGHPIPRWMMGWAYATKDRLDEAVEHTKAALELSSDPLWHAHLAQWLLKLDRLDEAWHHAKLGVPKDFWQANFGLTTRAQVLDAQGDRAGAMDYALKAVASAPYVGNSRLLLAQLLLAKGDWKHGWAEYEWRNTMPEAMPISPLITSPHWNGMDMAPGSTLAVLSDQGFGDTIQFMRLIPEAAKKFSQVYFGISDDLHSLCVRSLGDKITYCTHHWNDFPQHSAHVRTSSLPFALGLTQDALPQSPYLKTDPVKVAGWNRRLPAGRPRVGLVWFGRQTHPNDRRRSMRLSTLLPLVDSGATFVSLQKSLAGNVPQADLDLYEKFGMTDLSADLTDMDDTAALIDCLDLVITVDTGLAHMAGALGRPVWIMLCKAGEWRWSYDCEDSQWYPSARLFRQTEHGQWNGVVDRIGKELREIVAPSIKLAAD